MKKRKKRRRVRKPRCIKGSVSTPEIAGEAAAADAAVDFGCEADGNAFETRTFSTLVAF